MPLQGARRAGRLSLLPSGGRVRAGSPAPPSPTSSMGTFGPSRSKGVLRSPPALTLLLTPWAGNARGKRAVAFLTPAVAQATVQSAADSAEAGARSVCGWRTSLEPARGRGRRGGRGAAGGHLSHLHPSSVAMETAGAASPVLAATGAAALPAAATGALLGPSALFQEL